MKERWKEVLRNWGIIGKVFGIISLLCAIINPISIRFTIPIEYIFFYTNIYTILCMMGIFFGIVSVFITKSKLFRILGLIGMLGNLVLLVWLFWLSISVFL